MVEIDNFDPNEKRELPDFDPIPANWYAMQIVESERKTAKSGNDYLQLVAEIIESRHPEHKGRRVWIRLNMWHAKPSVSNFARIDLGKICQAIGHNTALKNTDLIHFKPFAVKVGIKPPEGQYKASNEALDFDSIEARFSSSAAASGTSSPAPASSSGADMPWNRGRQQ